MKLIKGFLGIVLAVVVATVNIPVNVHAEEALQVMEMETVSSISKVKVSYEGVNNYESSMNVRGNSITSATLTVTPRTSEILVAVGTSCSFTATKVGVRDLYVQEKVWYGWKTIAQAADYSTNRSSFAGQVHCTNATKGKTYRVLCTHYAIESNGTEHVVANQSEEFVYN